MSLANMILQRPAGYLMTDCGWFSRDGRLSRLSGKNMMFEQLGIALTCRGQHDMLAGILREMQVFEERNGRPTGADMIAAFPNLYRAACNAQGVPSRGAQHACDTYLLWYDPAAGRTRSYIISNETTMLPGLDPFVLQPVSSSFSGDIDPDAPMGTPCDVCDPAQFDVRRDGARLVEQQRREPWSMPDWPSRHYVAGAVHLTTVDAAGVRCETLVAWPQDRVGERVTV